MQRIFLAILIIAGALLLVACVGASPIGDQETEDEITGDITTGLVAYYPFSGDTNDASGNGNNPDAAVTTIDTADVTLTEDRHGNPDSAYLFNGTSSRITVPSSDSLESPTTEGTIAAWVSIIDHSQAGNNFAPIVMKSATNYPFMYQFYISTFLEEDRDGDGTNERYATSLGAQLNNYASSLPGYASASISVEMLVQGDSTVADPAPEVWHHVAVAWSGKTARFFLNGSLAEEVQFNGTHDDGAVPNDKPLVIGADYPGLPEFFYGSLDEIRIYNRALTDDDITVLYQTE
jgi:hypothetical protein